jgi:hypothetical protein
LLQKGFFSPAGARALLVLASAPESSEIFSSSKRDEGASGSSWQKDGIKGETYSDFIGDLRNLYDLVPLNHPEGDPEAQNLDNSHPKISWIIRCHGVISNTLIKLLGCRINARPEINKLTLKDDLS